MILIVDDFAPTRYLQSRILREQGYNVREADSAAQALEVANKRQPKLVLCDVHLPDTNGFALCRTLRTKYPDLQIIMTSATYTDEGARLSAMYAGAAEFISEPIPPERLVELVKKYLH
jgi:CheY-like chemotaxis protein